MTLPDEDAMEIAVYLHNELGVADRESAITMSEEEDFPRFEEHAQAMSDEEYRVFLQNAHEQTTKTGATEYTHESRA